MLMNVISNKHESERAEVQILAQKLRNCKGGEKQGQRGEENKRREKINVFRLIPIGLYL